MATRLLVYRRGGMGDILGLRPLLEAARSGGWDVEGCGDPERWSLLSPGLVSRVHWPENLLDRDFLAEPVVERTPRLSHEKVVFFTSIPSPGNRVWSFPSALPPRGENLYAYSARLGREILGSVAPPAAPKRKKGRKLLLAPGAGSLAKRWPLEKFLELARILRERPSFLLGPAESREFSSRIKQEGFQVLTPEISDLRGILESFAFYLGNDSGTGHLAAQEGLDCLILFGPTDPAQWAPPGRVKTLRAQGGNLAKLAVEEVRKALELG